MKIKRRIGLIADLHAGSNYGLCPPGFKNTSGNEIRLNKGQRVLWEWWLECRDIFIAKKVDTIICDGDTVQGQNWIERGVKVLTTDMDEQIDMGKAALAPLFKIPTLERIHFIQGSKYHVGMPGLRIEKRICKELNRENPVRCTWWGLIANIKFKGTAHRAHVIHGASSSLIYRSTNIDRRNLFLNAAAGTGKLPKFTFMIRAHWHWAAYLLINGQHNIQIPCFCLFIPWQGVVEGYAKYQPDIGVTIITIYDDEYEEDAVDIRMYLLPDNRIPMLDHELRTG